MIDQQDYRELVRMVAYEQAKLSTSAWFFSGEDNLRVRSFGSLASVVLAIEGRFLRADGEIVAVAERHVPNSDRTEVTSLHLLGQGFLLGLSVRASSGSPRVGQVFVTIEVVRGSTGAVQGLGALVAGYVTDTQRLAWPGTPTRSSIDGPGVIRSITGTNPAAGAEISETVPTNARWRLLAMRFRLVCDATVANRQPRLTLTDSAMFWHHPTVTALTAGGSATYSFACGVDTGQTALSGYGPSLGLPDVVLRGAAVMSTATSDLVAGDNYDAPQLLVEEWIED